MADRTRTITIKVNDQFSKQLRQFANEMDKASGSVKDLGKQSRAGGGFQKANEQLFYLAQNAQMVYGAFSKVFGTANEWAQIGVSAQRSQIALQSLVGTGDEYSEMIDAVQRATHDAVTEGEAAATAYSTLRFGLADSAEEMENFVRVAAIVGATSSQIHGTSEAITQISLTLSNMSFMRLDQLGISAGVVRKRMAQLKEETKDLTTEEAFQIAVMEELTAQADALGDSILGINENQEKMKARWRGFKEWAGEHINAGFEGAATAAESFLTVLQNLGAEKAFQVLAMGTLQTGGYIFEQLTGLSAQGSAGQQLDTKGLVKNYLITHPDVMAEFGLTAPISTAETPLTPMMRAAQNRVQGAGLGAIQYTPVSPRTGDPLAGLNWMYTLEAQRMHRGRAMRGGWEQMGGGMRNIYETMMEAGTPMLYQQRYERRLQGQRRRDVWESMGAGLGGMLGGAQGVSGEALSQTTAGFDAVRNAVSGATGAFFDFIGAGETVGQQFDTLAEKFGLTAQSIDIEVYDEMTKKLDELGVETEQANAAMELYQHTTGMATASSEAFDVIMENISESFAAGEMSAAQYVDQITRLTNTDLSALDTLLAPTLAADPEMYMQLLDRMGQVSTETLGLFANPVAMMDQVFGKAREFLGGKPGEEAAAMIDPATVMSQAFEQETPIITDYIGQIDANMAGLGTTGTTSVQGIQDSFSVMKDSALNDIGTIEQRLQALSMTPVTIGIDWGGPQGVPMSPIQTTVEIDGETVAKANTAANRRDNVHQGPGF